MEESEAVRRFNSDRGHRKKERKIVSITHKIEEIIRAREKLVDRGSDPKIIENMDELIKEYEERAGCICYATGGEKISELKKSLSEFEYKARIAQSDILHCTLHGPVAVPKDEQRLHV